ncbi:Uncharacterized membrane protein HdeD, DUF308 family [Lutimaribacter pacificus]|uniref:Uncharacterized membrane protein HdeD, DUF308 family n=2 Tax=Lutimaribacter pacificus TaxID=391948 RepID=A0A1H0M7K8_9RHOB|nr:Uncharacterized membrane protein HdeD, DUF308 family [Lutimaribacter pacificus]SHK78643.1 Uncharacterized membrane protein HdeD, DUF308 family [Lutimaribacter pacificus]
MPADIGNGPAMTRGTQPETGSPGLDAPSLDDSAAEVALGPDEFSAHGRGLLAVIGIASIVAGAGAILLPFVASVAAALVTGCCLVFSGMIGLAAVVRRRHDWQMASVLALSIVAIGIGGLMIVQPFVAVLALAALIIVWLGLSGALRIWYGIRRRKRAGAVWMVISGIAALSIALLLSAGLPFSAAWLPGVVLGIDLVSWGALLVTLAFSAGAGHAGRRNETA